MTYIERFGKNKEFGTLKLNIDGFELLSLDKKKLVYYLTLAGQVGNKIYQHQLCGSINAFAHSFFHKVYPLVQKSDNFSEKDIVLDYIKTFIFNNSFYQATSNKFTPVEFSIEDYQSMVALYKREHFDAYSKDKKELINTRLSDLKEVLFENKLPDVLTSRDPEKDIVKETSFGHYSSDLSFDEVKKYRQNNYPSVENSPMFGFNSFLTKDEEGQVKEHVIKRGGLFSDEVEEMIYYLNAALPYTENDQQRRSLETLIKFYETGDPVDFDAHSIEWLNDTESDIFFINGFIESYLDPTDTACSFESVVAFKNPKETKKVDAIIENIQWFEDSLPTDDRFKKKEAVGLSASSITLVSTAGESYPCPPLGICLPNSDWIRAKYGSKSVNLLNIQNARGASSGEVFEEFFLPEYREVLDKYNNVSSSLHTDLHEITGHGSGQSLSHVSNSDLGTFYNIIEEARADLVGLYFLPDSKLKEIGVVDSDIVQEDMTLAQYVLYITNGLELQLKRVELGNDVEQTHMRNRQLITNWMLENCDSVYTVEENGKLYIKVTDVDDMREKFGVLLKEIQRIKSEGDVESAKNIVLSYGTKIDYNLHKEVLGRYKNIDAPAFVAFHFPKLEAKEVDSEIVDISYSYIDDFVESTFKSK
tara:strand:- start:534 stop:2471 length:1938 start_codon:yes stop_codon:yes gene_type:complete